jgi:hypothetical protein
MIRAMNAKIPFLSGLVGVLMVGAMLRGEQPSDPYGMPGPGPTGGPSGSSQPPQKPGGLLAPNDIDHADAEISSWMLHPPGECCSPCEGRLIASEVYLRVGASFNVGGRNLNGGLDTGFDSGAGFRVSFFNHEATSAWVIDLGLSDIYNSTHSPPSFTLIHVLNRPNGPLYPQINVTPEGLNRTYFDYGVGREWYILGSQRCDAAVNWRIGADVGGRWGTAKMIFDQLNHRTGILEGVYTAIHSDVLIPWHCYTLTAGARLEWDYTWDHILQGQNNADLSGFNLLFTAGIMF